MTADDLLDMRIVRENMTVWGSDAAREMLALADGFAADARRAAARMRALAANGDAALVAEEAHRLKGAAASLGAAKVASECFALEQRAREGRVADLARHIDGVLAALEPTCARFRSVLR